MRALAAPRLRDTRVRTSFRRAMAPKSAKVRATRFGSARASFIFAAWLALIEARRRSSSPKHAVSVQDENESAQVSSALRRILESHAPSPPTASTTASLARASQQVRSLPNRLRDVNACINACRLRIRSARLVDQRQRARMPAASLFNMCPGEIGFTMHRLWN